MTTIAACLAAARNDIEGCVVGTTEIAPVPIAATPSLGAKRVSKTYVGSKSQLAESLQLASKEDLLHQPHVATSPSMPIGTSIFDLFKVGPGPSSSHTIGPMKASFDFLQDLRQQFGDSDLSRSNGRQYRVEVHLFGSLSATGKGHGTDIALVGGLLGWLPPTCDPHALASLMSKPGQVYRLPICTETNAATSSDGGSSSDTQVLQELDNEDELGDKQQGLMNKMGNSFPSDHDRVYYDVDKVAVGADSFVWHDPNEVTSYPHPNTVVLKFIDDSEKVCLEGEYYSVGGGFIQKKGHRAEDARDIIPPYPYTNFAEVAAHLAADPSLTWAELMMENEIALSGMSREDVESNLDSIITYMERAVERGLATRGKLPGPIKLDRKAADIYEHARRNNLRADNFLNFLNAYCCAASEENAAGHVVVTAPTSGASGVFPGLIYFMKHHLFYSPKAIRESMMVGACIGFLVKRNASISGAEMGCMGEVGTASGMGAAMLAYAAGLTLRQIEAAAETAIEHHLGLTCDPVGGYVQVPCIQRNPFGAVKAYNAYMMAVSQLSEHQLLSLDLVIRTMRDTGNDMHKKYKETSEGGLAANFTCC